MTRFVVGRRSKTSKTATQVGIGSGSRSLMITFGVKRFGREHAEHKDERLRSVCSVPIDPRSAMREDTNQRRVFGTFLSRRWCLETSLWEAKRGRTIQHPSLHNRAFLASCRVSVSCRRKKFQDEVVSRRAHDNCRLELTRCFVPRRSALGEHRCCTLPEDSKRVEMGNQRWAALFSDDGVTIRHMNACLQTGEQSPFLNVDGRNSLHPCGHDLPPWHTIFFLPFTAWSARKMGQWQGLASRSEQVTTWCRSSVSPRWLCKDDSEGKSALGTMKITSQKNSSSGTRVLLGSGNVSTAWVCIWWRKLKIETFGGRSWTIITPKKSPPASPWLKDQVDRRWIWNQVDVSS